MCRGAAIRFFVGRQECPERSGLSLVGVVAGSSMNDTALMAMTHSDSANAQAVWIFARFERRSFALI